MKACMVKIDDRYLYSELDVELMTDLLADVISRYESLFTFHQPSYLEGQAELLYSALKDGYGLSPCDSSIGIKTIDLRTIQLCPKTIPSDQWKEEGVGRILAQEFSRTINIQ